LERKTLFLRSEVREVRAMVKLGEMRKKERIPFREWLKEYAHTGRFPILLMFPPYRFPTFSLIFEDKNSYEVKMSVKVEKLREVFKALGLELKKSDLPSLVLEVVVDEAGIVYGLDLDSEEGFKLAWMGGYWKRLSASDKSDWEDGLDDLKEKF
jgi:hypothetical protein